MGIDTGKLREIIRPSSDSKVLGPFSSVSEVISNINGGRARGISLIGIKK